ncbi:LysR family transcriptional regulator [Lentibacter sp. XHP0401]|jgi:DNA-binding transcriptional LysR family regulator|uniref:LysR family transcriptional regulator n=1 Tax=Lentibacter sp. XHP0401 TaxID=2984334 RepID=UPI0021E6EB5A|nr:LysR family transcriptional regulator [Lentibacter sp. XHP0401]MCV2891940.1 LysR family transcriptional regulator [Lentibacter sp. XHP0401]
MTPNWDDMKNFLAVARAETLSGAAALLRADPATVGRRVSRLEGALGEVLFTKSPQGYMLTPQGQKLLPHAVRLEQAMLDARDALDGQGAELSGQIRLGAPDGCANFLLPQVCAAITAQNPDLDIQIVALPRIFNLSKREADMAITVSRPEAGRLVVQKLADYKLHLAASEGYLSSHPPISDMAALGGHRIVGYIPDMIFDKELDYMSGTPFERVALASNSASVQLNILRQSGGVGVVHDFALPAAPNLRKVLADSFSLKRSFYLIRHEDDRRVARLTRFAEALSEGVRREVAKLEALA